MPTSKRGLIKRKHDQAQEHVRKAVSALEELHEVYDVQHKHYSKGYELVINVLTMALANLEKLREFI